MISWFINLCHCFSLQNNRFTSFALLICRSRTLMHYFIMFLVTDIWKLKFSSSFENKKVSDPPLTGKQCCAGCLCLVCFSMLWLLFSTEGRCLVCTWFYQLCLFGLVCIGFLLDLIWYVGSSLWLSYSFWFLLIDCLSFFWFFFVWLIFSILVSSVWLFLSL